jgi:hypothetical protein
MHKLRGKRRRKIDRAGLAIDQLPPLQHGERAVQSLSGEAEFISDQRP